MKRNPPQIPILLASGLFLAGVLTDRLGAGDWPQWRGPHRDGHAAADETLPAALPTPLEPRWRQAAGPGFSSPVVAAGRLFVLEEYDGKETARALEPDTGRELWRQPFAASGGDEWGSGPRCTPVADEGRLFVQSLKGDFACLDQADGHRLWGFSFERDYGVQFVGGADSADAAARRRGNSGAPVILRDRIYVTVGATNNGTVVCFDKRSGSELWRAGDDEAAYASLMTARLADREQVIAYTAGGLLGFDVTDGAILWRVPLRTAALRHAVTPILSSDGVLVSSHTIGLRSFTVRRSGDDVTCEPRWAAPEIKTSLATMVAVDGHLYGQGADQRFLCVENGTGKVKWSQAGFGEKPLVGYSATLAAGGRLLVLSEDGQLVLLDADPRRYVELGRGQVCGRNWCHPALAGGRVYLRDRAQLMAFDLRTPAATR